MKKENVIKGRFAEDRCLKWLKTMGYEAHKTNIDTDQRHKIDIIATKGKDIKFIQVKQASFQGDAGEEKIIRKFVKEKQIMLDASCIPVKINPYYLLVGPNRIYWKRLDSWFYL